MPTSQTRDQMPGKKNVDHEVESQRQYYAQTAEKYEDMHFMDKDEHYFALHFMQSMIDFYDIKTVLDIGAGTGRVARYLKSKNPALKIISIEPVPELRQIGYKNGLSDTELIDGDATNLAFADGEFDLVCEFAVLHHVKRPEAIVREMLRVGRIGIFISDCNNFGQGSFISRSVKQFFNAVGLWKFAEFIKTRGKGYSVSEGDGVFYSYSVFNNYKLIKKSCRAYVINTVNSGMNFYRTSPHVALLGIKKEIEGL